MKRQLSFSAVALAVIGLAGSAQATSVFTGSLSNATDIAYTGPTLDAATSYTLGSGFAAYPGGIGVSTPAISTLGSFTINPITLPTLGLNTDNPINVTKTFTGGGYSVDEIFTDLFVTSRNPFTAGTTNLGFSLVGTIGTNNLGIPIGTVVVFGVAANQTGQAPGIGPQSWSAGQYAEWTLPSSSLPLPGALFLFGSVIAGAGIFMRRRQAA